MLSQISSPLALVRLVGVTGIAAALLLAGCARDRGPQTYGWQATAPTSIKDTWAPEVKKSALAPEDRPVASKPGATVGKSTPAPERPATPEPPRKTTNLDTPRAPVGELDCSSDAACLSQLKTLIDDPQRSWIAKTPTPAEYVQGTRLFAYRALKAKLICGELKSALAEIETASSALDKPVPGITPAQVARARSLGAQVKSELQAEQSRRCTS